MQLRRPFFSPDWRALFYQWHKDLQLLIFIAIFLSVLRLVLLATLQDQISPTLQISDALHGLWLGLRLDLASAAAWAVPTFLLSVFVLWWDWNDGLARWRMRIALLFAVVGALIAVIDIVYFHIYSEHFNQMIFGLVYDDTTAILTTIWKEYHPLLGLAGMGVLIWLTSRTIAAWLSFDVLSRTTRRAKAEGHSYYAVAMVVGLFGMLFLLRGGVALGTPLSMKHVYVTADTLFNRAIPNPMIALRKTVEERINLAGQQGFDAYWPSRDVGAALSAALNTSPVTTGNDTAKNIETIVQQIKKTATGSNKPPRHVFLILMESYSGWTLLPQYRDFHFADAGAQLANEGIYFPNFLPAGSGTIFSLNALVTGLPVTNVEVNHEVSAQHAYPTAIAQQFKRLGYRTRFFYGGFIGWQHLDTFLPAQGFDEVYGGGNMNAGTQTNEWGVRDQYLFDFVSRTVTDDQPSFSFILTTSNHPPYDIDLDKAGFPVKSWPTQIQSHNEKALRIMGHHWYADREFARFANTINQKLPAVLVAMTGDHPARFLERLPEDNRLQTAIVPFVLYGPQVLPQHGVMASTPGDHLNILPTLVELAAPAGFEYHSFRRSLLGDTEKDQFAVGYGLVMTDRYYFDPLNASANSLVGNPLHGEPLDVARQHLNAFTGLGWYMGRHFRGDASTLVENKKGAAGG